MFDNYQNQDSTTFLKPKYFLLVSLTMATFLLLLVYNNKGSHFVVHITQESSLDSTVEYRFDSKLFDIEAFAIKSINLEKINKSNILTVTGFIDLGTFNKGAVVRTKSEYFYWMESFSKIKNHMVFFTDSLEFFDKFIAIRSTLPTTVIRVNKTTLPSFKNLAAVQKIFAKPDYPPFEPDTKNADYVLTMNGKYDFVAQALKLFPYASHVMWVDMGLYRDYPGNAPCFYLVPPPKFNTSKVAYGLVGILRNLTSRQIVFDHEVLVCGCAFYGVRKIMLQFIEQFRAAVIRLISMELIASDQQTLFSIYADKEFEDLRNISIQTYRISHDTPYDWDEWFHLGYRMRSENPC